METLADRIAREGPINELDAVGWAIRLAKRIESMHALGVTHGNLSPGAIQIEGRERVARAQLVDVRRCSTSLSCQSPERVNGGDLSQADDTWALACTLYTSLTGNPAFSGADDVELTQKILASSPAPLAVFDVGDDDLQRILDDAFARDMRRRTTSVAALRAALEEWHPDPNVGALPAIEEEDTESGGLPADEDDERTILRSPLSAASDRLSSPFGPPSRGQAPFHGGDDDDEDARTIMRSVPEHVSSRFAGSASRSGAFAAMPPGNSGAFPAMGALADDEEATRMLPSPSFAGHEDDDEDDQKTLMRSSQLPDEPSVPVGSSPGRTAPRPLPAAGGAYPPPETPSVSRVLPLAAPAAGGLAPLEASPLGAAPLAIPLPPPVVTGAAPLAPAGATMPVSVPRRTALWITLVALLLATAAGVFLVLR